MSYNVIPVQKFKKEAKRLIKKYPSLKAELSELNTSLTSNPAIGISLGNNAYKIRMLSGAKEPEKAAVQEL